MHRASVIDSEAQKVLEAYIERGLGGKTGIELRFEGDAIDGRTERAREGQNRMDAVRRVMIL